MAERQPRYQAGQKIGGEYLVYQSFMGGMGEVYLCIKEDSRLPYALKTFQKTSANLQKLFEGEVRTWIDLGKHPNIVRCYWMQTYDNTPFMGLEWVQGDAQHGTDLRSWLVNGALDLKQALKFTIDICRGLVYAGEKSKGIVHRDLKPDNVLVADGGVAKITDFGLATIIKDSNLLVDEDTTTFEAGKSQYVGSIVGTPAYMPPEQWRGEKDIDVRADMYAVGCILYEMLTGEMVYRASTISQLRIQHFEAPIPQVDDVPAPVNAIITKCLAKNRDDRYPTMGALLDELTRFYEVYIGETLPMVQIGEMTTNDYINRGATYHNLKLYELALADFDEAICLNSTFALAYNNRGISYAHLGQHERAIADYDEAIRLNPTFALAYNNRGNRYADLGQHERAIADFDEAIRLNPTFVQAYGNRGNSYQKLGQHIQAIADFDEAIRLNPTFVQVYYNRGNSYQKLGQHIQAIADFDEAIHLNPIDADAWFNKGAVYGNMGRLPEALICFEKAHQLGDTDALDAIQQVKRMMGEG
jgi:serine/threonine protein kinase